jgi:kumamolisin
MRIARLAAPVSCCLALTLAAPTAALARNAAADSAPSRVLLVVAPQDRAALRALAHGGAAAVATDAGRLAGALPGAERRRTVADTARALGLTVDRVGTLSVAAHGPARLVTDLFGSARAVAPASAVQHPLPRVPAAFGGAVTVALGGDDTRPAFRPAVLDNGTAEGVDFRTAYGDTQTAPNTPLAALPDAVARATRAQSIATVQLSGWRTGNLAAYRSFLQSSSQSGSSWPVPSYTVVKDPFLPPSGHNLEVDLDQEALYSVAPYAHQRAYLSGNDFIGMYDSLVAIGDDASDPVTDHHIVAASISWGFCETDILRDPRAASLYTAMEDALSYVLSTGVTVFAASGDGGSTCAGTTPGVFYPASSPQVVGVGGTQHAPTGSCPASTSLVTDDPIGWPSSGGGSSAIWPRPAYQDGTVSGANRSVPDIAALAGCPRFEVVTSTEGDHQSVGGTSLASPVATATFAAELARHGYSWGVGDVLPGLYAQQAGGFTDVVDGAAPGYDVVTGLGTPLWDALLDADLGGQPHLTVDTAYSPTTRVPVTVRTPDWLSFDNYRIDVDGGRLCTTQSPEPDGAKPAYVRIDDGGIRGGADGIHSLTLVAWDDPAPGETVQCRFADAFAFVDTIRPIPVAKLSVGDGRRDVVASWRGFDGANGSGIRRYHVRLSTQTKTLVSKVTSRRGTVRVVGRPGKVYTLRVTAVDRAGHSRTVTGRLVDDRHASYAGGWRRTKASGTFDHTLSVADRAGARATQRLPGFSYTVVVTTCSSCGRLAVYVDGVRRRTVDTYSARTHHRVTFTVYTARRDDTRRVVVRALGTRDTRSTGTRVLLDALAGKG